MNAVLNSVSTVLLLCGYGAIRKKQITVHRALMISAFVASALFLVGYVLHKVYLYQTTGSYNTVFGGEGAIRSVYLLVLGTHVLTAMAIPLMASVTLVRGLRMNVQKHRAIARITLPVWLYANVTGVLVYFMLYHWYPVS